MQEVLKYRIADFPVKMNCQSSYLKRLCRPYLSVWEEMEEIDLCYSDEQWECSRQAGSSLAMFEYNFTAGKFVDEIITQDAFCYHSSALSVDGEGILFSADSGTGKSTHSRLWKEFMKEHEVINLNDDKPIIRLLDGKPWVYGSPWSGKHSINENHRAPVKAIVFLERGTENKIWRMRPEQVFPVMFPQVICGKMDQERVARVLGLLDQFIREIEVYKLQCNISEEAVRLVYDTVWKNRGLKFVESEKRSTIGHVDADYS